MLKVNLLKAWEKGNLPITGRKGTPWESQEGADRLENLAHNSHLPYILGKRGLPN